MNTCFTVRYENLLGRVHSRRSESSHLLIGASLEHLLPSYAGLSLQKHVYERGVINRKKRSTVNRSKVEGAMGGNNR